MVFVVPLIFILLLSAWLIYQHFKDRRFNELFDKLPSSHSLPLFGHVMCIRNPTEMLNAIYEALEDNDGLTTVRVGPIKKFIFTTDRHLIAKLCTSNNVIKSKEYKIFENWLGINVFTANGDEWKRYRNMLTPIAHISMLHEYLKSFNSTCEILVGILKKEIGKPIDTYYYMKLWALDAVIESIMGISLDVQKNPKLEYVTNLNEILRIYVRRLSNPLKYADLFYFFTKDYWKERNCIKFFDSYTKKIMDDKMAAKRLRKDIDSNNDKCTKSFLEFALERKGMNMTDTEINNHANAGLFAGHDTMTVAGACALYLLSKHQDIQEKLFSEIRQICGDDKTKRSSYEDLQKMTYLEMVLKETMRLYPPVPLFAKYTLEDIEHNGRVIPKGSQVVISIIATHMREKYYPNPHVFNPERFASENQETKPFTYLPFGAGLRICMGQKSGMLAMKASISTILRNFKILPIEGYQMKLLLSVVHKPDSQGIKVILTEREY